MLDWMLSRWTYPDVFVHLGHEYWCHELPMEKALTPSPSPVGRERVAVRPGEGQVHGNVQIALGRA